MFRTMTAAALCFCLPTHVCAMTTEWVSTTPGVAAGLLSDSLVAAQTTGASPFAGISLGRMSTSWDTNRPLSVDDGALSVLDVNAGDRQLFEITPPLPTLWLYIENFDSGSAANIEVSDGATVTPVELSAGLRFDPATNLLITDNLSFDGVGDAILSIQGGTEFVAMSYTAGSLDNGVFYTFAVPEPMNFMSASLLLALGLSSLRSLRK